MRPAGLAAASPGRGVEFRLPLSPMTWIFRRVAGGRRGAESIVLSTGTVDASSGTSWLDARHRSHVLRAA